MEQQNIVMNADLKDKEKNNNLGGIMILDDEKIELIEQLDEPIKTLVIDIYGRLVLMNVLLDTLEKINGNKMQKD